MADELYQLQIITPERKFYDSNVKMIVFKSTEGDIGVLKNHIPLTTTLSNGLAVINEGSKVRKAVLHGGFAEISANEVTILTDYAEWLEEIDLARAKEAKKRAENNLSKQQDDIDIKRAKEALQRAQARIEALENSNIK